MSALTLVELGRAKELDTTTWLWTWNQRDNFVVACNDAGNTLYIFKKPRRKTKLNPNTANFRKGSLLYGRFRGYDAERVGKSMEKKTPKNGGFALHVIYHSDKFGDSAYYIHEFEKLPKVWVDNPKKPTMIKIVGGKIKVTARGIEG